MKIMDDQDTMTFVCFWNGVERYVIAVRILVRYCGDPGFWTDATALQRTYVWGGRIRPERARHTPECREHRRVSGQI